MKIQLSVSGPIWNQFIGVQIFTQLYNRAPGDSTVTSSTLSASTSNSNSCSLDIKTQFDRIPRRGKASGMRWNKAGRVSVPAERQESKDTRQALYTFFRHIYYILTDSVDLTDYIPVNWFGIHVFES